VKISAIVSNLATNCIVRSWPILKVLERHHQVEVIGSLAEGEELFPPYAREFDYQIVRRPPAGAVLSSVRQLEARITGDVVYAFKPLTLSYGVALVHKLRRRRPVVLDIEDWETWNLYRVGGVRHAAKIAKHLIGPGWTAPQSDKYRYTLEQLTGMADSRTVVSTFLQRRFGGTLLRHGADTRVFDPSRFDRKSVRDKWGIGQSLRLVLFSGSPTAHKGVDDILAALTAIGRPELRLLMAGKGEAPAGAGDRVIHLGFLPHAAMPELLAMADVVALPQQRHPVAEAQIPAKVFEAMAMGKPVVVSAISDLPDIVDGGGIVVEPGSVSQLAAAIDRLLQDRQLADELGERGRARHEQEYSWNAMERVLTSVFRPFA
jgi:glycosyltransferase involved in cell wall biosynthesis